MEISNPKMNYMVIKFINNDDISISAVPSDWVQVHDGKTICSWPRKAVRTSIVKRVKPEAEWATYEVELIKECETYHEAFEFELKSVKSDESEREMGKGKRKIKTKYVDDIFPARKRPTQKASDTSSISSDDMTHDHMHENRPTEYSKYYTVNKENLSDATYAKVLEKFMSPDAPPRCNITCDSDLEAAFPSDEQEPTTSKNVSNVIIELPPDQLHGIMESLNEIKATQRVILNILNNGGVATGCAEGNISENLLPRLPCQTIDEVLALDENITANERCLLQLEQKLKFIGGFNPRNCVHRCLQVLFTNKLAESFSWTGQKNNIRVKEFQIISVLKSAVKKTYSTITDRAFEDAVMAWFRHSKQRTLRQQNS